MRKMMKYGKAYCGADPEMIEGDVFRIIVKCPDFEARQTDSTELLLYRKFIEYTIPEKRFLITSLFISFPECLILLLAI